jgi:hypothetical protein
MKVKLHHIVPICSYFDSVAKTQVLAHLANFAYDPVNYEWLRKLHVLDLFIDMLTEENEQWKEFGMSGICNLCLGVYLTET